MNSLNVELYGDLSGKLSENGKFIEFDVDPGAFGKYQSITAIEKQIFPIDIRATRTLMLCTEVCTEF